MKFYVYATNLTDTVKTFSVSAISFNHARKKVDYLLANNRKLKMLDVLDSTIVKDYERLPSNIWTNRPFPLYKTSDH